MKKYWILIVISVVMVASIGTFYIQSVFAVNNMPEFTIEKRHGDEKEIESLFASGLYYDKMAYFGEQFEIGLEGTNYWKEKSFLERMDVSYDSPRIKELQKDHRNFMRGKYSNSNSYFENEDILVYADVSYKNPYTISSGFQFKIAVLDKKTNKTTSFEHLVPNGGDFWYLDTIKVQVVDDQLGVITRNDVKEDDRKEIHLYTFNIAKETLVNDEVILSTKDIEDKRINIATLNVDDSTRESKYLAFVQLTFANIEVEDEGFMEEVVEEELIVYDLPLNTSTTINLKNLTEHGHPEYLEGANIYFTEIDGNGVLKIAVYDIESEQIIDSFDVELPNSTEGQHRRFNEGKLYIVDTYTNFETSAFATVINLKKGEKLFEGEIKYKDQKDTINQVELYIQDILFK